MSYFWLFKAKCSFLPRPGLEERAGKSCKDNGGGGEESYINDFQVICIMRACMRILDVLPDGLSFLGIFVHNLKGCPGIRAREAPGEPHEGRRKTTGPACISTMAPWVSGPPSLGHWLLHLFQLQESLGIPRLKVPCFRILGKLECGDHWEQGASEQGASFQVNNPAHWNQNTWARRRLTPKTCNQRCKDPISCRF